MALVRPLLTSWRRQTEAHCRTLGLRPRRDRTNSDTAFFRNRLRHKLLPELETYNPRARQVLVRTGEVMRAEAELFDEVLAAVAPAVLRLQPDGTAAVAREAFKAQPVAIQRALVAAAAHRLAPGLRDFGYDSVELARSRILTRVGGRRTALPGAIELRDEGDRVLLIPGDVEALYPGYPQLIAREATVIAPPACVPLRAGALVVSVGTAPSKVPRRRSAAFTEPFWLDRARLGKELVVRPPQPGDRMRPLGMLGHRKVADIFNGLHIPGGARRNWPIVLSGGEVVCLVGLRIGHDVRLTSDTRRAMQLRFVLAEGAAP
jgi:tRNA(Ile)-lysidine synthase